MDNPIVNFIKSRGLQDGQHIGDGVYVADEGHQVWLIVERFGSVESVAIDDRTWQSLVNYMKSHGFGGTT